MSNDFNLITSLSPEECVSRLASVVDHESLDLRRLHFGSGSKSVIGEVTAGTFTLHQRSMGRNSFKTIATGTFQPTAKGTVISGQFSADPRFRWGYGAWGCFMFFIGVPIVFDLLRALLTGVVHLNDLWTSPYEMEAVGLIILLGCPLIFLIGRFASSGDDDFLWQFLVSTLEAHPE